MDKFYNLHNLINIKINQGKLNLADGYNHYLRYFNTDDARSNIDYEVKEFSQFQLPKEHADAGGVIGFKDGVCFNKDKYALVFSDNKITEYTTYPNRATNLWIQLLFLKRDLSFIHGAGVEIDGKGVVFPAFGGTGKTVLISELRKLNNCKVFGDDYVIVNKAGKMFSYPSDFSIYPYHISIFPELKNSTFAKYLQSRKIFSLFYNLRRLINFIWRRISQSGMPLLSGWNADYAKVPAKQLIGENNIGHQTNLTMAVFLSRYSGDAIRVEEMSLDQLTKSTDGILWLESQHALPYLAVLSAFGLVDVASIAASQQNVLKGCFAPLKRFHVYIPHKLDADSFVKYMTKFIQEIL
ncbi:MAG: hypothetical protein V1719_01460 [Patescibacteria group bacterium]